MKVENTYNTFQYEPFPLVVALKSGQGKRNERSERARIERISFICLKQLKCHFSLFLTEIQLYRLSHFAQSTFIPFSSRAESIQIVWNALKQHECYVNRVDGKTVKLLSPSFPKSVDAATTCVKLDRFFHQTAVFLSQKEDGYVLSFSPRLRGGGAKGSKTAIFDESTLGSVFLLNNRPRQVKKFIKGTVKSIQHKRSNSVSLCQNELKDRDIDSLFRKLGDFPWLTTVAFACNSLTANSITFFPKQLQEIDISNNSIGDRGLFLLSEFSHLWKLNVAKNDITAIGVNALVGMRKLTVLDLSSNRIGDQGGVVVASHPTLCFLKLIDTEVGNQTASVLAESSTLQEVDLTGNGIDQEGVSSLIQSKTVKYANLFYNKIEGGLYWKNRAEGPSFTCDLIFQKEKTSSQLNTTESFD